MEEGSITLHPAGFPMDRIRENRGKYREEKTLELAVMIDTFRPLRIVKQAHETEDEKYMYSWIEQGSYTVK